MIPCTTQDAGWTKGPQSQKNTVIVSGDSLKIELRRWRKGEKAKGTPCGSNGVAIIPATVTTLAPPATHCAHRSRELVEGLFPYEFTRTGRGASRPWLPSRGSTRSRAR